MTLRTTIALVLGAAALAGGGFWLGRSQRAPSATTAAAGEAQAQYYCPMHPTFVSDRPGECAICGMKLVRRAPAGERRIAFYRSPMDPTVRSATPAKDEMGMDYVAVYEDELGGELTASGRAVVTLTPERRQLLGVRSEEVEQASLGRMIRTVGRVVVDERRLHHVHTKYEGYVERLYVDFTGKFVKKGEPLLSVYSPDLVATQQEYLLAYRAQQELERAGTAAVARGGQGLLEAARQRLLFWDVSPRDIGRIEETGQIMRTLDLYAPMSGYVVQKMAFHGMRVMPQDTLFDIADLTQLWVLADVYEADLPSIRLGMPAELEVPYLPGKKWRGSVTYVAPTVEEKTRTVKVRVEVANAGQELKPEMFADVFLSSGAGTGLVVPEGAVVRTGDRDLVFVDRGEGRLEPRDVQLGSRTAEGIHVLRGLAAGERVVTTANFLLDSESSMKAALSAMEAPRSASPSPAAAGAPPRGTPKRSSPRPSPPHGAGHPH
jgi:multidrug efflux pump subunit AcrA (membrane-fusion protein)